MKKCKQCGKILTRRIGEFSGNWKNRKYCDISCYRIYQKNNPNMGTFKIGNSAPTTAFKVGQTAWNVGKPAFWAMGNKNVNWNGGRIKDCGYIAILKPNHPRKNSKGYVREHRLVVEKILGRYLSKTECVHHINEIKTDNRPENLFLFSSNTEHSRYHKLLQLKRTDKIISSNLILDVNLCSRRSIRSLS